MQMALWLVHYRGFKNFNFIAFKIVSFSKPTQVNFDQDTSAGGSCSLVWENQFYIFGGNLDSTKTQISKLDGCMVKRTGDLDFDFESGACTNFNNQQVYLCFPQGQEKQCRFLNNLKSSNPPSYKVEFLFLRESDLHLQTKKSKHAHSLVRIASSKSKSFINYKAWLSRLLSFSFWPIVEILRNNSRCRKWSLPDRWKTWQPSWVLLSWWWYLGRNYSKLPLCSCHLDEPYGLLWGHVHNVWRPV